MERSDYRRREPEKTVLYRAVQAHLNTFLGRADQRAEEGRGLPKWLKCRESIDWASLRKKAEEARMFKK